MNEVLSFSGLLIAEPSWAEPYELTVGYKLFETSIVRALVQCSIYIWLALSIVFLVDMSIIGNKQTHRRNFQKHQMRTATSVELPIES